MVPARYSKKLEHPSALVLFDIDGTLIRRAGPCHREALVEAILRTTGLQTTTDGVPVAGMLDGVILSSMMANAGLRPAAIRRAMPEVVRHAQNIYVRQCPNLQRKVCPGVRRLLERLQKRRVVTGLVTGNLSRIGWKKMEQAGLKQYFRFGAFAELAKDRAGLVRIALRQARREGWVSKSSTLTLIGDHPNDIQAARANGLRCVAVATGVVGAEELASYSPDILAPDMRALSVEMLL
jgi:phosphoglycolate phosphatase